MKYITMTGRQRLRTILVLTQQKVRPLQMRIFDRVMNVIEPTEEQKAVIQWKEDIDSGFLSFKGEFEHLLPTLEVGFESEDFEALKRAISTWDGYATRMDREWLLPLLEEFDKARNVKAPSVPGDAPGSKVPVQ